MAYYVKKGSEKQKKTEGDGKKKQVPREKAFFYQIVGCVIVMVVVAIIGVVKSLNG